MEKKMTKKRFSRRSFIKTGCLGVAALAAATAAKGVSAAERMIAGKKLAMVIDLQRCSGCGACLIACKNENNVQAGFLWANRISSTVGRFPNVRYDYTPTLCNHCERAPCVRTCPTRAMHKGDGDITMHNPAKCIGCRMCKAACPYKVISFNKKRPHAFWRNDKELIKGCTSSPTDVVRRTGGKALPYYNPDREGTLAKAGVRYKGIVEKCTLCDHRIKKGVLPRCVEACPAKARIFGDINDPNSAVNRILGKHRPFRLKEYLGTEPKVFYVRSFNPAAYKGTTGRI